MRNLNTITLEELSMDEKTEVNGGCRKGEPCDTPGIITGGEWNAIGVGVVNGGVIGTKFGGPWGGLLGASLAGIVLMSLALVK